MSHAKSNDDLRFEPVGRADEALALELLLAHLEPAQRRRRIAALAEQYATRPIEGLWAAYRGQRMVGTMRAQVEPGKTALVTAPRVVTDEPPETAAALLARVVAVLEASGVRLARALLETDAGGDAEVLRTGGFRHAADLLYLVSVRGTFPETAPAAHLEFVSYSPEGHQRLAELIERTYRDSLDCRAVDGVWPVDDVLEGYKRVGPFDPARWLIVRQGTTDVGCLLLGDDAANDQWELAYLGVVPEARGRGLGLSMTRHAQWLAKNSPRSRLVLAVDAVNSPAIAAYAASGFVSWDRRSVFLRVF